MKKIVTEKSSTIDHLNVMLVQHKHDLESSINRIEVLTKKIKELEIECINGNAKITELSSKNHEISKLLHKMQDQLNKRDQVRLDELKNYSVLNLLIMV